MRNNKGQFVKNHPCLCVKDKKTGKFVCRKISEYSKECYQQTRIEVDRFLEHYGGAS